MPTQCSLMLGKHSHVSFCRITEVILQVEKGTGSPSGCANIVRTAALTTVPTPAAPASATVSLSLAATFQATAVCSAGCAMAAHRKIKD